MDVPSTESGPERLSTPWDFASLQPAGVIALLPLPMAEPVNMHEEISALGTAARQKSRTTRLVLNLTEGDPARHTFGEGS